MRDSVLALTKGWHKHASARSSRRHSMTWSSRSSTTRHSISSASTARQVGRVYIVSASPEEIVAPLARYLGVDGYLATRSSVDDGRPVHRSYGAVLLRPAEGRGHGRMSRRNGVSTSQLPMRTATRRRTSPCSNASATRSRSIPIAKLQRAAREHGWEIRTFTRPRAAARSNADTSTGTDDRGGGVGGGGDRRRCGLVVVAARPGGATKRTAGRSGGS